MITIPGILMKNLPLQKMSVLFIFFIFNPRAFTLSHETGFFEKCLWTTSKETFWWPFCDLIPLYPSETLSKNTRQVGASSCKVAYDPNNVKYISHFVLKLNLYARKNNNQVLAKLQIVLITFVYTLFLNVEGDNFRVWNEVL